MTSESLTELQIKIAQLSARGLSTRVVGAETGVSAPTVWRNLKLPQVQAKVEEFKQEFARESLSRIEQPSENLALVELKTELQSAAHRQRLWNVRVMVAGERLLDKVANWMDRIDEVQRSGQIPTPFDMLIMKTLPSYARAAADMSRAGSDAEDKIFALEEMARRLDAWDELMNGNNSDARQVIAGE